MRTVGCGGLRESLTYLGLRVHICIAKLEEGQEYYRCAAERHRI
jgi:hypothetical protein